MAPLILAAIQAVVGQKQKRDQEEQQRRMAAAQGQAFQQPKSDGLGTAAGLAGGFLGGNAAGGQPNAMSEVDGAIGSYDKHKGLADAYTDEDDMFGGIGR